MSARPLVAVALGDPPDEAVPAALGASRVFLLGEQESPAALAAILAAEQADVLWLPAWCAPGPDAAAAVARWRARPAALSEPSVARAPLLLHCGGGASVRVAARLVLSSPGAAAPFGEVPRSVPGALVEDLAAVWDVRLPEDLASHLEAVNRQTSVAARLRHAAGQVTTWRDLTLGPAGRALRALGGMTGSRREAVPRVVIEGYREVLVAAKLWELGRGAATV